MAIYFPPTAEEEQLALDDLTPREIVAELDKYVVGQKDAKRAVAIALRNRMRRQKLPPELAEEVMPKNIIMIGPTGVGKTEIARRLAKLDQLALSQGRSLEVHRGRLRRPRCRVDDPRPGGNRHRHGPRRKARRSCRQGGTERRRAVAGPAPAAAHTASARHDQRRRRSRGHDREPADSQSRTREKLRQQLREGKLDERMVELDVRERNFPSFEIISNQGVEEMDINLKDMLAEHLRAAKQEAQDEGRRGLRVPDPGRRARR